MTRAAPLTPAQIAARCERLADDMLVTAAILGSIGAIIADSGRPRVLTASANLLRARADDVSRAPCAAALNEIADMLEDAAREGGP